MMPGTMPGPTTSVSRPMPSRPLVGPPPHIRRRRARLAMAVVLLLAITIGAIGWWLGSGRYTEIPGLAGQEQADAIDLLQQAGLDPDCCEEQFSETVADGVVISATPAGGEAIRGTDVRLVVSKGPERFVVPPELQGKKAADVSKQLQETMPLQVAAAERYDDQVPPGHVIGFEPPAGTQLKRGQVVKVVASLGRAPVAVPDVVGLAPAAATANLEKLGFVVQRGPDGRTAAVAKGEVMGVAPAPAAGAQPYGSTVTITVSAGVPQVEVPDVTGMTQAQATAALQKAGLKIEVTEFFGDLVQRQSPAPAETVDTGTTVKVLTSFG
jgi:serine/threonine-protein kinase